MTTLRYSVAACQTDLENPIERGQMRRNTGRMLQMIDSAVAGAAPFLPVRLVVFPEFAHAAPVFETLAELREKLAVEIPNEHTEKLHAKAREHDIYIQSGSMLEVDPKYAGAVFNTTCLIGPDGIAYKYRKVNTWIPYEVHTSPHDIAGYEEPLFPVAETPIGRLGCAICYDWLFPEALRQLAASGRRGADPRLRRTWTRGERRPRWTGGPSSSAAARSRIRLSSSPPTRVPASSTIRRTRGPEAAR